MIAGTQAWWFLSRGSGIVAWCILAVTNLWGIVMVTRIFRARRPAWMLDLHRWLGALAIITTGIHLAGLVADTYVHFGWTEILLPNGSAWRTGAVTWGVIALYVLIAIEVTSLLMQFLPRRVWHSIHLLSYMLFAIATVHGIQAGTDAGNRVFVGSVGAAIAALLVGVTVRVVRGRAGVGVGSRRRTRVVPQRDRRPVAKVVDLAHRGRVEAEVEAELSRLADGA